jgi:hypothetical protein
MRSLSCFPAQKVSVSLPAGAVRRPARCSQVRGIVTLANRSEKLGNPRKTRYRSPLLGVFYATVEFIGWLSYYR